MPSGYPRKFRGNPFDLNLPVEDSIRQYAITWGRVALERTKENEEEARKALSDIALGDDLLRAAIDFLGLQVAVRLALGEKCIARGYTVCAGEKRPIVAGKPMPKAKTKDQHTARSPNSEITVPRVAGFQP